MRALRLYLRRYAMPTTVLGTFLLARASPTIAVCTSASRISHGRSTTAAFSSARVDTAEMVDNRCVTLRSGAKLPSVGLGTWQSKRNEVGRAVTAALEAGYTHIDCAAAYANEVEVGVAIASAISKGVVTRDALFITSKLWNDRRHPADVRDALRTTLDDLGVEYLDLYLIHWPVCWKRGTIMQNDSSASLAECWAELERAVDAGLIRAIGVSNFNEAQIAALLHTCRIPPGDESDPCLLT